MQIGIRTKIFPDSRLPCSFNENALDDVSQCWDDDLDSFSNFPERTVEKTIKTGSIISHNALGVKHGLIQMASVPDSNAQPQRVTPVSEGQGGNSSGVDVKVETQHDSDRCTNSGAENEVTLDFGEARLGFVVAGCGGAVVQYGVPQ